MWAAACPLLTATRPVWMRSYLLMSCIPNDVHMCSRSGLCKRKVSYLGVATCSTYLVGGDMSRVAQDRTMATCMSYI